MRRSIVILSLVAACSHSPSHSPDGPPGGSADATETGDTPTGDAALIDAPPDGTPIMTGSCANEGSGVPAKVSGLTRPLTGDPLVATNGTTTLIVWTVGVQQSSHAAWALLQGGSVISHGDLLTLDTAYSAQLFTLGSKYLLYGGGVLATALLEFDGTTWTQATYYWTMKSATSGGLLAGLVNGSGVTLFDGTTMGSPQTVSTHPPYAIAGDNAGGFGVVAVDSTSAPVIHFVTYNGVAWSAESLIGTDPATSSSTFATSTLVHAGTRWAFMYTLNNVPTVWTSSATGWTSTTFGGLSSSKFALVGNETAGTIALAGDAGYVAVLANDVWSQHQLNTAAEPFNALPPILSASGAGFVDVFGVTQYNGGNPLYASIYDGTSWAAPTTLTATVAQGLPTVATDGTTVAIGFATDTAGSSPLVTTSTAGGAWSTPYAVTTSAARYPQAPAVFVAGGTTRIVYGESGAMQTRTGGDQTWSTIATLPATATAGPVYSATYARAGNGHALAAWIQADVDRESMYASEFDGTSWSAPVFTGVTADSLNAPDVAASGSAFVIGWNQNATRYVAKWTGAGLTTPTSFGAFSVWFDRNRVFVGSDGTRFLAAWSDASDPNYPVAMWTSSSDGTTWSTPVALETGTVPVGGWNMTHIASGKAGALVADTVASDTEGVRLWSGGTFGPQAMVYTYSGHPCVGLVGDTTAAYVCGQYQLQSALYANGAWTAPVVAANNNAYYWDAATDGTDYRIDMAYFDGTMSSTTLHAGAWSTPVADPGITTSIFGVTGACGGWRDVFPKPNSPYQVASATGAAPYGTPTRASVISDPMTVQITSGPEGVDAIYEAGSDATLNVPALYIDLGL